jgi:hypothetical protein
MTCASQELIKSCKKNYHSLVDAKDYFCNATVPYDYLDYCEETGKFTSCVVQDCNLSAKERICEDLKSFYESHELLNRYKYSCSNGVLKCSLNDGCFKACQNSQSVISFDGSYPPCGPPDPCYPDIGDDEKYALCQVRKETERETQKKIDEMDRQNQEDYASDAFVHILVWFLIAIAIPLMYRCFCKKFCKKKKKVRRKSQIALPERNNLTRSNVPYLPMEDTIESGTGQLKVPLNTSKVPVPKAESRVDKRSKSEKSQSLEQLVMLKKQGVLSDEDFLKARERLEKI